MNFDIHGCHCLQENGFIRCVGDATVWIYLHKKTKQCYVRYESGLRCGYSMIYSNLHVTKCSWDAGERAQCHAMYGEEHSSHPDAVISRSEWLEIALKWSIRMHSYLTPRELHVWQVEQAFVDWTAKLYNDPEYVAERMESLFREDMEYREWRAELLGPEVRDRYNVFLNFLRVERDDLWGHQVPLLGESKWSEVE